MRRRAQGLIAGFVVTLAAAGCGGGGEGHAGAPAARDAAKATAPASALAAAAEAEAAVPVSTMRPAGPKTELQVRALLGRFIDAMAARNAVATCRLFSPRARRAFEARVHNPCEHGMVRVFQQSDFAGRIAGARVTDVRVRRGRGIVALRNGDDVMAGEDDGVAVERVGGRWWLAYA
jgi:hypothetical protein